MNKDISIINQNDKQLGLSGAIHTQITTLFTPLGVPRPRYIPAVSVPHPSAPQLILTTTG